MTSISIATTPWVTLRKGDVGFMLDSDYTLCSRAGLEISAQCPPGIATVIADAMARGWLEPVALVPKTDPTLMWDILKS